MESGGVVGHGVGGAVDVGDLFPIAVVALVEAGGSAQVGSGRVGGDSALAAS